MLVIDGSHGEGGGQILRTALALSLVTQTPCRIERIRAGRAKPGLLRQHLTAAQAAAAIGGAEVTGLHMGSTQLTFTPKAVTPGAYAFQVGTAGSAMLVLQTVLPALMLANGPSTLHLQGGTHNPAAPPFDFLAQAFLPLLNRMGPTIKAELDRPGFYPAGGGECRIEIDPVPALAPLDLYDRGAMQQRRARSLVANLPRHIGERELAVIEQETGWPRDCLDIVALKHARGPGNIVIIELAYEHVTEVFTGFGARRVPAEAVARHALAEMQPYADSSAAAGVYLADQLLLPCALAGGGGFTTLPLSPHAVTNIHVIEQFLDVRIESACLGPQLRRVEVHLR